jgi:anti-anti-sigma regulatory factor
MLKLQPNLKKGGRQLVLCNLSREISEVFRVTRLGRILNTQPDVDAPLASLSNGLK